MKMDAPIPGENFTSDTKNYPWHRPPEHTDLDEALDDVAKRIHSEEAVMLFTTMMESGIKITALTEIVLMSGVMKGRYTLDYALIMAGPVSHMFVMLAKEFGIKYKLGIEGDNHLKKIPTKSYLAGFDPVEQEETQRVDAESQVGQVKQSATAGFMGG